ncbi:DUF4232 domain-containing protein [Pseudonocardiaceae bacterium YIM PH 21723]|nr:DUF4232 domain-containing protein [Pseudonocardiaceae bacterium YIM PH 21723]
MKTRTIAALAGALLVTGLFAVPASAAPAIDRCHSDQLRIGLVNDGAGAGNRYAHLVATNSGLEACTLYGFPGLQLTKAGAAVATQAQWTGQPGPATVTLQPNQAAATNLHWTAVAHEGEPEDTPCQPIADTLQVIPPDETTPVHTAWNGGPVCGFGAIDTSAFYRL